MTSNAKDEERISSRNEDEIHALQTAKASARERLQAARAEMMAIDTKLLKAGASVAELSLVCM